MGVGGSGYIIIILVYVLDRLTPIVLRIKAMAYYRVKYLILPKTQLNFY